MDGLYLYSKGLRPEGLELEEDRVLEEPALFVPDEGRVSKEDVSGLGAVDALEVEAEGEVRRRLGSMG